MSVFAVLDNKVYTMSDENATKIRRVPTKMAPGLDAPFYPYGSWDESHDLSAHVVHSMLDISAVSLTTNEENVKEVIDAVNTNELTELLRLNPAVKMTVTYSVLDAFHNELESKVSKVTIGTLNDMIIPMSLNYQDHMEYLIAQNITSRVVLAAAFRELGISKSTRSASRMIAVHNVTISISTTDESVYSQFLLDAQSKIGWTPSSPTQGQVSEYDIPIFNLADTNPQLGLPALPHYIEVDDRSDKVYLDIDLTTSLFAYTLRDQEIERAIVHNQQKKMQYKIITATDIHCNVDKPIVEHIDYGSYVELNVTADTAFRISKITIESKFHPDAIIEVPEGAGSDYACSPLGNPEVLVEFGHGSTTAKITISCIGESYALAVYTSVATVVPPEEGTPSETPDDNVDGPSGEVPSTDDSSEETSGGPNDGTDSAPDAPPSAGDSSEGVPSGSDEGTNPEAPSTDEPTDEVSKDGTTTPDSSGDASVTP